MVSCCHCTPEMECSQYHFLEQPLDKIIRTEVKVEEMQKQVDESLKHMKMSLSSFEEANNRRYTEDNGINEQVEKVTLALKELPHADESLVPTVVFNARDVEDESVAVGQKYVFTNVLYNHGDGYDNTTGTFSAPVDGTYIFTINLHVCVMGHNYMCYDIVYEGKSLSRGVDNGTGGGNPCSSINAIVVLRATEKVWVESNYQKSLHVTD